MATTRRRTPRFDVYQADCPTRLVLDRIADKWTVLVLLLLDRQTWRFNELRRAIEGLSPKMLSHTLKTMERDGLISRKAYATVPVTVEYDILPLGRTLAAQMESLRMWAETHVPEVLRAQARYDRAPA